MSSCGLDVPRVAINDRTEAELSGSRVFGLPGKRCAPSGGQNLPGGVGRNIAGGKGQPVSEVLTGPRGWSADKRRLEAEQGRSDCDRTRGQTIANASLVARTASFKPPPRTPLSDKVNVYPAGGRTQGAKLSHTPRSQPNQELQKPKLSQAPQEVQSHKAKSSRTPREVPKCDSTGYDPTKHAWYHPKGRAKQAQLKQEHGADPNSRQGSWLHDMRKAKDHVGYGNGSMARGRIQTTAVSREVPDWMVGVRMADPPPPFVQRFPAWEVTDGKVAMNTRIFEHGPNFSVKEKRATLERPRSAVVASTATTREKRNNWVAGERPSSAPSLRSNSGRQRPRSAPCSRPPPSFDNYKGTFQTHVQENQRCLHGSFICDHHPCRPHNTLTTSSSLMGTGCVTKMQYAPKSEWVGIDPKIPGGA